MENNNDIMLTQLRGMETLKKLNDQLTMINALKVNLCVQAALGIEGSSERFETVKKLEETIVNQIEVTKRVTNGLIELTQLQNISLNLLEKLKDIC